MVNIDLKDRKILYRLDLNCRQSYSQIGKKVGLSKKVVEYRIKRMEKEKIIAGYWTCIDSYRFGYQVYRYYIIFQNTNNSIRNKIIKEISDYKNTWVVNSLKGIYDLTAVIWVKSIPQFYNFWDSLNGKYGDYFAEKIFSIYLSADRYPLTYLILNEKFKKDREKSEKVGAREPINITFFDYLLLNEIAENAKISSIELAEKLGSSTQKVRYHTKQLIKNGVIQGFHTNIDIFKFGYYQYKVDIWLREISKRKEIWNYLKYNPYVTFINTSAGYADIEIEFTIENSNKLIEIMEDVSAKFPDSIRRYIFWSAKKTYKLRCLPELSKFDFNK